MSRIFSSCGHPFVKENTVKEGGGRVRCKKCRHDYALRTGRIKPKVEKPVAAPPPARCCADCDKTLHNANTSGFCFRCYTKHSAAHLYASKMETGLTRDIEVASDMLLRALWREHPGVLAFKQLNGAAVLRVSAR